MLNYLLGLTPPENKHYEKFVEDLPSLEGKTVAITGTTSGTGYWAAAASIQKNATALFLLNRDSKRAEDSLKSLEELKEKFESGTELIAVPCDFNDSESVKAAAEELNKKAEAFGGLNVIANNAGIMAFPDKRSKEGFDIQMQVNFHGQYLLSKLVVPSIKAKYDKGEQVRVVQHSSAARFRIKKLEEKYFRKAKEGELGGDELTECMKRYQHTKLANSTFAMALAEEIVERGLDEERFLSIAAEPGFSVTSLGTNLSASHKERGWYQETKVWLMMTLFLVTASRKNGKQSAADGSMPLLQAMFGDDVNNGDFFMPENGYHGLPVRSILKGKEPEEQVVSEETTLDKENKETTWKLANEVNGEFFEHLA